MSTLTATKTTKLTVEIINKMSVGELRKIFTGTGYKFPDRDGVKITVSTARKDELIKAAIELFVTVDSVSEIHDDDESEIHDSLDKIVNNSRVELIKLSKISGQLNLETCLKIKNIGFSVYKSLRTLKSNRGTYYGVQTVLNMRDDMFKTLKIKRPSDEEQCTYDVLLELLKAEVDSHLKSIKWTRLDLSSTYQDEIKARQHKRNVVYTLPVLKWATETLHIVDVVEKPTISQYYDVCLALIFVTGRRTAEVIQSGLFEYVDKFSVKFSGQLKTKNHNALSYVIPTLANADLIIKAHKWLRDNETKLSAYNEGDKNWTKRVNLAYSTGLSRRSDACIDPILVCDDGKLPTDENDEHKFTSPHRLRELYAQICSKVYRPESMTDFIYIGDILGHTVESRGKTTETAQSYNSYYKVKDGNEIKQFLGLV